MKLLRSRIKRLLSLFSALSFSFYSHIPLTRSMLNLPFCTKLFRFYQKSKFAKNFLIKNFSPAHFESPYPRRGKQICQIHVIAHLFSTLRLRIKLYAFKNNGIIMRKLIMKVHVCAHAQVYVHICT